MQTMKEMREMTGLSQQKFGDFLHIPRRTIQDWELENRKCPEYVAELIAYKLQNEGLIPIEKTVKNVYPAVFSYGEKEIAVVFPDLDVATSGTDEEDAFRSAHELLCAVLDGIAADGNTFPVPTALDKIKTTVEEKVYLIQA